MQEKLGIGARKWPAIPAAWQTEPERRNWQEKLAEGAVEEEPAEGTGRKSCRRGVG